MTTSLVSLVEQLGHVSFLFKSFSRSLPSWRIKSIFLSSTLKVLGTEQVSTSLFYASSFIHKGFSFYWMKLRTTSLSLKDFPKCNFVNFGKVSPTPFRMSFKVSNNTGKHDSMRLSRLMGLSFYPCNSCSSAVGFLVAFPNSFM